MLGCRAAVNVPSARACRRLRGVGGLLVPLLLVGSALGPAVARGQSPSPTIVGTGDPRSEGEGAGLVGAPFLVAFGVIALGLLTAGATLLFVRLTRDE